MFHSRFLLVDLYYCSTYHQAKICDAQQMSFCQGEHEIGILSDEFSNGGLVVAPLMRHPSQHSSHYIVQRIVGQKLCNIFLEGDAFRLQERTEVRSDEKARKRKQKEKEKEEEEKRITRRKERSTK